MLSYYLRAHYLINCKDLMNKLSCNHFLNFFVLEGLALRLFRKEIHFKLDALKIDILHKQEVNITFQKNLTY